MSVVNVYGDLSTFSSSRCCELSAAEVQELAAIHVFGSEPANDDAEFTMICPDALVRAVGERRPHKFYVDSQVEDEDRTMVKTTLIDHEGVWVSDEQQW
ncbi:hypothetical protein OB905_00505 [Halobacteria archaeon AArc-dxtr1]|nr:hypothetical protein [Halobacteria archaeon AArc-dxtr1]